VGTDNPVIQGGHKPGKSGILSDFLNMENPWIFLREFCATSGKTDFALECSLCQPIHMQPSVSGV